MTERENWLRAVQFNGPEWIPCQVAFSPLTWHTYRERLEEVVLRHPRVFPGYKKGDRDFDFFPPGYAPGEVVTDSWGCVWKNGIPGLEGQVVGNPLADWDALATYTPPDPERDGTFGKRDWEAVKKDIAARKQRGELTLGDGERLFDRLYSLRGFENLMMDFATGDPNVYRLIDMVLEYEMKLVEIWLDIGVDAMAFHTDIGTQKALMISPDHFRKYIKPMFKQIFAPCVESGTLVLLSSDGALLEIVDDLIECGVSTHDPQVRANTLDGIEKAYKGKMCVNLDLDRQMFPFCTPADINAQVKEAVDKLCAPEGGLMMVAAVYDEITPLENMEAICEAMEEYCLLTPIQST